MASIKLTTRNTSGVIANLFAADKRAVGAVKRRVRDTGFAEYTIAYGLCPVGKRVHSRTGNQPGFMRDHLTLTFLPSELGYELGWYADDFTAEGEPFYPIYVEFPTVRTPAQPSLFPARDAVRPQFHAGLRRDIRTALRRRGRAA